MYTYLKWVSQPLVYCCLKVRLTAVIYFLFIGYQDCCDITPSKFLFLGKKLNKPTFWYSFIWCRCNQWKSWWNAIICSWFGLHWLCSIDFRRLYQTVWYWLQDVSYCEIWMVHWIPWTCRERDFDKREGDQRRQKNTWS